MRWMDCVKNQEILVTGGFGGLGAHVCKKLFEAGANIHVVDDLSRGSRPHQYCRNWHRETITRGWASTLNLGRYRYIIHLSAKRIPWVAEHPDQAALEMGAGSYELWKYSEAERIVYASSASVYDDSMSPFGSRITEYDLAAPRTHYGRLKLFVENFAWCDEFQSSVALRFFNLYGPGMLGGGKYDEVFMKWMRAIQAGHEISADAEAFFDWVYLRDAAEAVCRALLIPKGIYNVGTGYAMNLAESAKILCRIAGRPRHQIKMFDSGKTRYRCADVSKIKPYWRAETDFEDGARAMWEDFVKKRWTSQNTKSAK